ncbi:hypothetical protein G7Y79_00003g010920 [Physcia stellaris]|nr:hypothetical protein G7Y79_00003g010920 [Physcia stellaris]
MAQDPSTATSLDNPTYTRTSQTSQTYNPNDDSFNQDGGESTDSGVVNYYFLLLALFVILVTLSYCCISRRRRRRVVLLRTNRQDALERDLEGWQGGRYWGPGRWRTSPANDTRPEEGLDERGLPPPPYIPAAPKPTHPGTSHGAAEPAIPLQVFHNNDQKPPDYVERSVGLEESTLDANRPTGPGQH